MKKILLIIPLFLLILIGAGCDDQTELIKQQQEQIKDLENKVESFIGQEETVTTIEEQEQKEIEIKQYDIEEIKEETENKFNIAEKDEFNQIDCTYSCLGKCYNKDVCLDGHTFQCGTKPVCCPKDTIFCNDKCYTTCSEGTNFYCPKEGGNAQCLLDDKDNSNFITKTKDKEGDIIIQDDSSSSELMKIFNDKIEETKRQNEIILEQLKKDYEEKEELQVPIQDEIDLLNIEAEKKGCNDIVFFTGSKAQDCNILSAKISGLALELIAINNNYAAKLGITPKSNFNFQQPVLRNHYQFYYDGKGNGTIYNANNILESYSVYCNSGVCNMYGN